jgi:uncharacterized protein
MASSTPPSDGVPRGVTQRQLTPPGPGTGRPTPLSRRLWVLLALLEATAAALAALADLLITSLVLLAMALVSLSARRRGFGTLGLRRLGGGRVIGVVLGLTVVWSVVQLSLTMPHRLPRLRSEAGPGCVCRPPGGPRPAGGPPPSGVGDRRSGGGTRYRGYLLTRIQEAVGGGRLGTVVAVVASSVLFGIAHAEQGVVGVVVVTLDGVFFCALRYRYRTLWASVLAHGFNNTFGLPHLLRGGTRLRFLVTTRPTGPGGPIGGLPTCRLGAEAELELGSSRRVPELGLCCAPLLPGHQRADDIGEQLLGGHESLARRCVGADGPVGLLVADGDDADEAPAVRRG